MSPTCSRKKIYRQPDSKAVCRSSGQKFLYILLMIIMALSLCVGLMPSSAYALDDEAESGGDISNVDEGDAQENEGDLGTQITINQLFIRWSTDYEGTGDYVGSSPNASLEKITITKKGQYVQLNTYYNVTPADGNLYETANSDNQLGSIGITWTSSDPSIASVDILSGLVTPLDNGVVTITATVTDSEKYGDISAYVELDIDGQSGEYVSLVEITDADGNVINDTIQVDITDGATKYVQLGAIIHWVDPYGEETRLEYLTADTTEATTSYRWASGGESNILSVNETTGRVSITSGGIGSAMIYVEGGVGGQTLIATVYFRCDDGVYGFEPADSLTINVCYEDYPDEIIQSRTYTLDELAENLDQYTYNYTIIKSTSTWGTIRATGYRFIDLIQYINQTINEESSIYIDFDDIKEFRFGTADAYDQPISYSYLFGVNRFYYPDFDIGNTGSREVVPPLLALASRTDYGQSIVNPNDELYDDVRFRLVFGPSSATDANSSKQIYYINTIKILINGSPPEQADPGIDGSLEGGGGIGDGDTAGTGTGTSGTGTGAGGSGGGSGTGNGEGDGSGIGSGGGTGAAGTTGYLSSVTGIFGGGGELSGVTGSAGDSTELSEESEAESQIASLFKDSNSTGTASSGSGTTSDWKYYQTLIKSNSDIGDLDFDNPLSPYVLPCAAGSLIVGGLTSFIGYRRKLF